MKKVNCWISFFFSFSIFFFFLLLGYLDEQISFLNLSTFRFNKQNFNLFFLMTFSFFIRCWTYNFLNFFCAFSIPLAAEIICDYMKQQNRPYNEKMVFENLHGVVGNAQCKVSRIGVFFLKRAIFCFSNEIPSVSLLFSPIPFPTIPESYVTISKRWEINDERVWKSENILDQSSNDGFFKKILKFWKMVFLKPLFLVVFVLNNKNKNRMYFLKLLQNNWKNWKQKVLNEKKCWKFRNLYKKKIDLAKQLEQDLQTKRSELKELQKGFFF